MAFWNDDPYYADDPTERPYGWGRCYLCDEDCEEDDYDDGKRRSTCKKCHARQAQSADEEQAEEVFTRR